MAMKNHNMYGEWINLSESRLIGEKALERNSFRQQLHILWRTRGAEAIAMDPKVNNERAIKCYEKCGFTKVKVLKEHELHEGVLEDCWMMEYKRIEDR